MQAALSKMKNGLIAGTRVKVGDYDRFQTTSCVRDLGFLNCVHEGAPDVLQTEVARFLTEEIGHPLQTAYKLLNVKAVHSCEHEKGVRMRKNSVLLKVFL